MSQYFDMGEVTLWNPSNGPSQLFRRLVPVFEAEVELPSGIGPMENDECQVDPDVLGTFVAALLERHRRTSHTVALALCEGFTATVLVLAERAGVTVAWDALGATPEPPPTDVQVSASAGMSAPPEGRGWVAELRAKARDLGSGMPR